MSATLPSLGALYRRSPTPFIAAAVNVVLLLIALVGLAVDHRVVTGAPVWLKPVKFATSVPLFLLFLAWMMQELSARPSVRRAMMLISWILTVEVMLIFVQAARGTSSHFNADTPLDAAIFSTMGAGIATVWIATMFLLWIHLRTTASDRLLATAFRIGLALNIMGAAVGWRMTTPSAEQVAAVARGERPRVLGAHTVGGRDGGPGLALTGWSTEHGDLRAPHFVGMHALQLLPLLLLVVRRVRNRDNDAAEAALLMTAASMCAIAFAITLSQALRGLPLLSLPAG